MRDELVSDTHYHSVLSVLSTMIQLANGQNYCQVKNLNKWRPEGWLMPDSRTMAPYRSVYWYIKNALNDERKQLFVTRLVSDLYEEPWQNDTPHYDVLVTGRDLYDTGCNFVIGSAVRGHLAILSTARFQKLSEQISMRCFETEVLHEIGHMFGLPDPTRGDGTISESLGAHCTNPGCTMRQGLRVPDDWIRMSAERHPQRPFCPTCLGELRHWFLEP